MIAGLLLSAWLALIHPQPLIAQVAIDCARIIGLPRLKTMDGYLYKMVMVDEWHSTPVFAIHTREEFFTQYFKIAKLKE